MENQREMNKTNISWCDYAWNPIAMLCTPVSPGCQNCWHLKLANRMAANPNFPPDVRAAYAGGGPVLLKDRLWQPGAVKKPSAIAVQLMGDLWHPDVTDEMREQVFAAQRKADWHRYMLLTKRPENIPRTWVPEFHCWVGVTVESARWGWRSAELRKRAGISHRFLSLEPLLGPLDVALWLKDGSGHDGRPLPAIDLVIIGCESGPGRRETKLEWVKGICEQCWQANVPVHVKQLDIGGKVCHEPTLIAEALGTTPEQIRQEAT
jgi:protein gp37